MTHQPRSTAANILREVLGDSDAQLRSIQDGNDGEKFEVLTSKGKKLFCRVKRLHEFQELPYQEAEILERTNSPHIVKPRFVDRVRNHYVIVTPFIEGISLEARLRQKPLSTIELENLANVLFECVAALSDAGAVHFDIKPANIMVGVNETFYLVDFGAAKFVKRMRNERIYPARKFIAPEVLKYLFEPTDLSIQRLTTLTDMYGVGGVLYTAASGHNLTEFFRGSSDILQKVPPPVRTFVPTLNPRLANIIDQLLTKEPARRFSPENARTLLRGGKIEAQKCPVFFLKTKPRGEHAQMMDSISAQGSLTGIYWASASFPQLPKRSASHNLLWETPWRADIEGFKTDLTNQYQRGVFALCVPSQELENRVDAQILAGNTSLVDVAIEWRNTKATHLPVFSVIAIDEALLNSAEANTIRDAYAAKNIDGIIFRVCMPGRTPFDIRHLNSIRTFIEPLVANGKSILFDGDLSVLPLSLCGVSGLVSTTYPRLNILSSRRTPLVFAVRPDGMYIANLLSIISADNVTSLRASALGRNLTNCNCSYCATNFMHRNRLARWDRPQRRQHFISTIPRDILSIKELGAQNLLTRIEMAQREALRARPMRLDLSALQVWYRFLQ
jgi:serine/threonine protein kinase